MVRQLVPCRLANNALKVLGVDVAIAVLVEAVEGLSNALALKASQQLGELRIVQVVAVLVGANVQLGPFAVPVEGNVVRSLVELVQALEVVVLDDAGPVDVEQSEGDFVLGIGLEEEVLEDAPISQGNSAGALAVGDSKEDRVLLPLDLVLFALDAMLVTGPASAPIWLRC